MRLDHKLEDHPMECVASEKSHLAVPESPLLAHTGATQTSRADATSQRTPRSDNGARLVSGDEFGGMRFWSLENGFIECLANYSGKGICCTQIIQWRTFIAVGKTNGDVSFFDKVNVIPDNETENVLHRDPLSCRSSSLDRRMNC